MSYFYIKSGFGTRTTGGGTTAQTGTMAALGASNVYNDILDALADTTPPVAGDIFICSDLHAFDNGGSVIFYVFPATGIPIQIYSVDDANIDQYSAGASETTTSSLKWSGKADFMGVDLSTGIYLGNDGNNVSTSHKDCTLTLQGGSDYIGCISDGVKIDIINTTIACGSTGNGIRLTSGGGIIRIIGSAFTATTTVNDLIATSSGGGGGRLECTGTDLSVITGYLLGNHGSAQTSDDRLEVRIDKCKLNASVGFVEETLTNRDSYILVTNSAPTSAEAEHQYYSQDYNGNVKDQASAGIHRDESTAYGDGEKVSFKCTSSANVSRLNPLVFDAPSRFAELSSASTDTIRIYFTVVNTTTLTDQDIWAELIYPDGTNKHLFNYLSNENADPLATGTTHTTDSGSTWKNGGSDLTGYNEYYMDLDTSGDVGHDCVPLIRINIGIPSEIIYIDTTVDVVA